MPRHISSLVSDDSRNVYQRLRRSMCFKILESYGLPYPSGASQEAMVKIMEANGVDPTKPGPHGEGVKYQPVPVKDDKGNVRIEMYPEEKPHATANKDINYQAILDNIAKERQAEQDQVDKKDGEIAELQAQVAMLMEKLGGVTPEMQAEPSIPLDYEEMEPEELQSLCKERGIKVHHKLGKKKLIEALTS